jgi:hypothetical protein
MPHLAKGCFAMLACKQQQMQAAREALAAAAPRHPVPPGRRVGYAEAARVVEHGPS